MNEPNEQLQQAQEQLDQIIKNLEQRLVELEQANHSNVNELREELFALKCSLEGTQRGIQNELQVALRKFKGDLRKPNFFQDDAEAPQISNFIEEWKQDKQDIQELMTRFINDSQESEQFSSSIFRLVGYGLLILAFLDIANLLTPPNFANPSWELQIIAGLVQRAAILFLGLMLVFYKEGNFRPFWERILVKFLSYLSLVLAVGFILLVPLGVLDTVRLNNQNSFQFNNKINQQSSQLQELGRQVNQASSIKDVTTLYIRLEGQSPPPQIQDPQQLKNKLLSDITQVANKAKVQAETAQANQRFTLIKNSIGWNISTLLISIIFFLIWRITFWARSPI